jgi:hypothetical protein
MPAGMTSSVTGQTIGAAMTLNPPIKTKRQQFNTMSDDKFTYFVALNPDLEQWRVLGAEWVATLKEGKYQGMQMVQLFVLNYINRLGLETIPARFFRAGYTAPCFYTTCLAHYRRKKDIRQRYRRTIGFLKYVLKHYFSIEDDLGNSIVSPGFRNPIPPLPDAVDKHADVLTESNKGVLPYRFIAQLRAIACPKDAVSFTDWKWAHTADDMGKSGGSWFIVPETLIDRADPDCVWRVREASDRERHPVGLAQCVYEIWCPARSVALFVKLHLPLRTFQVRMLDSGEADTQRYEQGRFIRNTSPLAKGSEKNPLRRGVFRQMRDDLTRTAMTGLFINTNKTADLMKDEWSKGYNLPWEHQEVLYWLERLRNWQQKYNPISAPLPWTSLKRKHIVEAKSNCMLKSMGASCFLFRDAAAKRDDRNKPIAAGSPMSTLWCKLLQRLEDDCDANNERDLAGDKLIFVKNHINNVTHFPLHSLRVSLITAYALEGGVPMTILSRCIAGHSRLLMTIYYTKAGITYCTELMDEATKRLLADEQENYTRWLKDKTYEQLEANGAYNDPVAIHAMMQAMQGGAGLIRDDKGYCPKGGWGCDSGGVYIDDYTGKVTYGEVPGYPQKNCPRCRYWFTGYAFMPGIENHWNNIQIQMGDVGERIVSLGVQITALEDDQYECQQDDRPFLEQDKLHSLRKTYQAEIEKNNKLGLDLNATQRIVLRCRAIASITQSDDGMKLVAVGDLQNATIAIRECPKLQQILTVVAGSMVYPEHDVSKYALQAAKAFDTMFINNDRKPILIRTPEDKLPGVVVEITKMLVAETGSIQNASPFIEGERRLAELGREEDIDRLAQEMEHGPIIRMTPAALQPDRVHGQRRLPLPVAEEVEERSNG